MDTLQSAELRQILNDANVIDSTSGQRPNIMRTWYMSKKPFLDWKGDQVGTYKRTDEGRTLASFMIDENNAMDAKALAHYFTENGVDFNTYKLKHGHGFSIAYPSIREDKKAFEACYMSAKG